MTDLIAEIQNAVDRKSELRLLDAVATGANTVTVGQSTVAVTLPAIIPVVSGDFCQVLEQGANRLIVGPIGSAWANITLSSGNWTLDQQPQWRKSGGRIELRGWATRTSSTFTAGATLFATGGSNPPVPAQTYRVIGGVVIAAATPDAQAQRWIIDAAFASSSAGWAIAVGDSVSFDGIWWPIA